MKRSFGAVILGALLVTMALGALAQAESVKIVWDSATGKRGVIGAPVDFYKILIDKFHAQYPDIEIEHNFDNTQPYLLQIASGGGPDVIIDCCPDMRNAGVAGTYLDLTPFFGKQLPDFANNNTFYPAQFETFNTDGKQYAVPQYLGAEAYFANRQMFADAGIDIPSDDLSQNHQTWAEFEAMCKKLTKIDAAGKVTQYGFAKDLGASHQGIYLLGAGAHYYVDGDHSKSALASPEAVAALEYLQRLHNEDQCLVTDSDIFDNGHAAVAEEGPWDLPNFLGTTAAGKPKKSFDISVFPIPIGPSGRRTTKFTMDGIAISKNTKHLDAALKFLNFLASKEASELRAQYNGLQPARADVNNDFVNLMEALNPKSYRVNAHVFTDAAAYAQAPWIYDDMKSAESLLEGAVEQIVEHNAPAKTTWYPAVEALNNIMAGKK